MKIDSFKVKLLMAENEMGYYVLAERTGISQANLSQIISRQSATIQNVGKIAKAMGVPASEIAVRE